MSDGSKRFSTAVPLGAPRTVAPVLVFVVLVGLIQPRFVVPGLGAAGRPAALFGLGLMAWWLLGRLLPHERRSFHSPILAACFIYLLSFIGSLAAGLDRGLPSIERSSMDRAVLVTLGFGGVILVAQETLRSVDAVERVAKWLVITGFVGAVVAIVQFAFDVDLATSVRIPGLVQNADQSDIATRGDVGYRRVRGMALHPIEHGVHLAMVLPLAVHVAMNASTKRRSWWIVVGVIASGIPLSISRSGMLALAVALGVYAVGLTWRQRANAAVITVIAGLAFMAVTPGLLGTIRSLFQNTANDNSVAGRTDDYTEVGEFVRDRPVLGRGPGTYIPSEYRTLDNQFLATLIESGWVGLAALVFVLGSSLWVAYRLVRTARSVRERSLARALGAGVAVAPVTSATFDALGFPIFAGTLITMIGCLAALYALRFGGGDTSEQPRTAERDAVIGRA